MPKPETVPQSSTLPHLPTNLCGEITNDIGKIATPERPDALLPRDAHKAVDDALVTRHFTRANLGMRVLGLQQQLHTLDWSHHCLGYTTRNTTGSQILGKAPYGGLLLFPGLVQHHVRGLLGTASVRGGGMRVSGESCTGAASSL